VGNMAARFANGMDIAALGERIRLERQRRQLSLEVLAAQAGVSRSMLSHIERGEKVPSVLVLDRIATGLGTSIARLLGEERSRAVTVLRRDEQDVTVDPAGWERYILSPVLPGVEFEFMRTTLNPGVDAGVFSPHAPGSLEWVALEGGTLCLPRNCSPRVRARPERPPTCGPACRPARARAGRRARPPVCGSGVHPRPYPVPRRLAPTAAW
jgi:transcriptional regulator with XRE-family HTH domain